MAALPKNNRDDKPSQKSFAQATIPYFCAITKYPDVKDDELNLVMFFVDHFERCLINDVFEQYQNFNLTKKKNGISYNACATELGIRRFLDEFAGMGFLIDCFNEDKMCVALNEKGGPVFAPFPSNDIGDAYFDRMMDEVTHRVNERLLNLHTVRQRKEEINQKFAEGKQDEQSGIVGGAYYDDNDEQEGKQSGIVGDAQDEPGQVTETPGQ